MAKVKLDGALIKDWDAFHSECQREFGFPESYGRTMDAWVDCMSYLRDDEAMSKFHLAENEVLEIAIANSAALKQNQPEILDELTFCVEAINDRYADYGEKPALKLLLQ